MVVTQEQIDKWKLLNKAYLQNSASKEEVTKAWQLMLWWSDKSNNIIPWENKLNKDVTNPIVSDIKTENQIKWQEFASKIKSPIDTWWMPDVDTNNINNQDYFFNTMLEWQPLQKWWIAVEKANERFKDFNILSNMSLNQIWDSILWWQIKTSSQSMIDLRTKNPELYSQVSEYIKTKENLNDINNVWGSIYNSLTSTKDDWDPYSKYKIPTEKSDPVNLLEDYNKELSDKIVNQFWENSAEMFTITQEILQNPQIQWTKNKIEELQWNVNKIQENIYTIWDTTRQLLWSEAPEDLLSAYIWQQTKYLQNNLRTANNELMVEQWKLDNYMSEMDMVLDAFYQWMEMDASLAKAESKAQGRSWSGWGGGWWGWGWSSIYQAMIDGTFTWQYTEAWLKPYWLKWYSNVWIATMLGREAWEMWSMQDVNKIIATMTKWLDTTAGNKALSKELKNIVIKNYKETKFKKDPVWLLRELATVIDGKQLEQAVVWLMKWLDKSTAESYIDQSWIWQRYWFLWLKNLKNRVLKNI